MKQRMENVERQMLVESEIEVPTPANLLGASLSTEKWLMDLANTLHASADFFQRVASAGLMVRFSALAFTSGAPWQKIVTANGPSPASRMMEWAGTLSSETLDELESCFVSRCGDLALDLEGLPELVSEEYDNPPEVDSLESLNSLATSVRSLCKRRDELESVGLVLQACGRMAAENLIGVDELAATMASTLGLADEMTGEVIYDKHLEMVSVERDGAWWGPCLLTWKEWESFCQGQILPGAQ